jgi:hypothetical protein
MSQGVRGVVLVVCGLLLGAARLAAQEAASPPASAPPTEPVSTAEAPPARESERAEGREIETDRDSFTPATTTAGRGRLIVESAYSFLDNRKVKETHSFPELILRYGLLERVELRLGWNYEVGGAGNDVSGADVSEEDLPPERRKLERESNLAYGVKLRVTDDEGWVPGSSLILQGFTPTSGKVKDTQFVGTYVFGWELPARVKLDAAMRYGTASGEEDRFSQWAPSVVVKVPLTERWNAHAEYFGIFTTGKADNLTKHFFSPGTHYLVTENVEVGVRVGWGLNDQSARFFCNAGLGCRF